MAHIPASKKEEREEMEGMLWDTTGYTLGTFTCILLVRT